MFRRLEESVRRRRCKDRDGHLVVGGNLNFFGGGGMDGCGRGRREGLVVLVGEAGRGGVGR